MRNSKPVLSVVIITYNQIHFLKQTIDSVRNQITNHFFEIIVSDDCSNDETEEYCRSINNSENYNFKYVRMTGNGGITANCNLGLRFAEGKYITIIGGDDLFLPSKIQYHIDYMESNPSVVISYHPVDIFDSLTDRTILVTNQSRAVTPMSATEIIEYCIPGSVSVVVRSSALPKGRFDTRLPIVSDWLYYIEIAAKGDVGFLNKTLARYRKHGNQASSKTYMLLEESLDNLNLAKEKLPHLAGIDRAITQGKSRYLMGEAYRQLVAGDRITSRKLIHRALSFKKSVLPYGLLIMTYFGSSFIALNSVKRLLKRIL